MCSEIARLLKQERLRQKLSLNLISSKAGLSRQTVSFIENEERTPTVDTLLRLTSVLEIKLEDLIRRARKYALAKISDSDQKTTRKNLKKGRGD
jgi:transcriptional regulator with XRE-family HTH domain